MNYLKQSKHRWMILAYGIFYMTAFMLVEKSDAKIHILHSTLDDMIPFCKYFIIPYVMWYFFLIGTVAYFAVACESKREYYQYLATLGIGMTLFLLISWIYPNGQDMRPELVGNDVFTRVIRYLYQIDTPTNIFPSMHVFNATASAVALYHNKKCRSSRVFTAFQLILSAAIVLSTMFLKQHCTADVAAALILNVLCYIVFYRVIPENEAKLWGLLTKKEICTIPNLLSAVRIGLACAFLGVCARGGLRDAKTTLSVLLIAAVITDILDSLFANEFHQTSSVGKFLDPFANKLMQGVVFGCLAPHYEMAEIVFLLFLVKETYTLFIGGRAVLEADFSMEPQWHGKLNTAVSSAVSVILIAGERVSYYMANVLLCACALYMLLSFILYAEEFREALDEVAQPARRKVSNRRRAKANWIQ